VLALSAKFLTFLLFTYFEPTLALKLKSLDLDKT
jgi:predicted MFS family arabinose efflux permease